MLVRRGVLCVSAVVFIAAVAWSQPAAGPTLKPGATVYINAMPDGFDTYLRNALVAKKVPVVVVDDREQAQFEIKGSSETQKAGAAKKIMMWDWRSDEQASISVTDLQSGEIVFAYTAHKKSSAHGKRSTAEACAKHLKNRIEKGK